MAIVAMGVVAAMKAAPVAKAGAAFCKFLASCGHGVVSGSAASGQTGIWAVSAVGHRISDWAQAAHDMCPKDANEIPRCPQPRAWDRW